MRSKDRFVAEPRLARAISSALEGLPIGEDLCLASDSDICSLLERYIPEVLAQEHPKWSGESLDGIFVSRARKVGCRRIEILGTGILITDQTVTPLLVELQPCPSASVIGEFEINVGEPGEGALGISGPPCHSGRASRLLHRLEGRHELQRIDWVYSVAHHGNGDSSCADR